MSGGITATTVLAAAAAAGTAYSIYSGERQASAQNKAQKQAKATAEQQAKVAEEATNKASQKSPDTSAILSAAEQSGKAGASSTMLTGSQGVDASSLALGRSTLLGS